MHEQQIEQENMDSVKFSKQCCVSKFIIVDLERQTVDGLKSLENKPFSTGTVGNVSLQQDIRSKTCENGHLLERRKPAVRMSQRVPCAEMTGVCHES